MPRANRYIVAGPAFHVTHRCHNREFLFRFARDRDAYRSMMREQLESHWIYQSFLQPAAEVDSNNAVISRFVYATRANVPDYMVRSGVTYRIITDHLGSVRLVVNATNGVVAQRMDYDEWGVVTQDTNPGFQPFGYAGGMYDSDTKLVRFGYRDYDPAIGRWLAKDPILFEGGDPNLYAYVGNDPINWIDTSGLSTDEYVPDNKCHGGPHVDRYTKHGKNVGRYLKDGSPLKFKGEWSSKIPKADWRKFLKAAGKLMGAIGFLANATEANAGEDQILRDLHKNGEWRDDGWHEYPPEDSLQDYGGCEDDSQNDENKEQQ